MFKISNRLTKIAGLVPNASRVADIGTDHGYLPIYLVKNGIANYVLACDINEKPLSSAKKNICEHNADNIELLLCNGLSGISPNEIDAAVIAGMGGEVIAGIIGACSWIKNSRYTLILQPTTSPEKLREYLAAGGFSTISETAVCENGKLYSIIKAKFSGSVPPLSGAQLYIGKLKPDSADSIEYIKKQLGRLSKLYKEIKDIPQKADESLRLLKIINDISEILGGK